MGRCLYRVRSLDAVLHVRAHVQRQEQRSQSCHAVCSAAARTVWRAAVHRLRQESCVGNRPFQRSFSLRPAEQQALSLHAESFVKCVLPPRHSVT
eukprot:2281985-Pleurochrysis_carterae.AAC.2